MTNMKKIIIGILSILFVFNIQAQESGKKAVDNAKKELKPFFSDMASNAEMAIKVLDELEANFGTPEKAEAFIKKGELYYSIVEEEEKNSLINPQYKLAVPFAAERAMLSYIDAIGTDKEKDAFKKLPDVMGSISILGNKAFDSKEYTDSYKAFRNVLKIHDVLSANGQSSTLDEPEALNQQKFYTVVSATYSPDIEVSEVEDLIKDLYETGYDHSFVYESYFDLLKETNVAKAEEVLTEGRAKYPEESGLLYSEINYYLQKGELEKPINNIKYAIEKDPQNITLYTTLGSVYDQLNQKARESGNVEEADKYFDEAKTYFSKALEIDGGNSDANYSIGALYYNKAASMTEKINELSTDYSAEGTKKYEAAKEAMMELFKSAQPYFEKAHQGDMSNRNAIIALKEIYARLGDFEKSNEMKAKLETIGG